MPSTPYYDNIIKHNMQPDYIFETSWEVCNRVGGIYAVLSTRAASMQAEHPDQVIFFGPDFGQHSDIYFREDKSLLRDWRPSINVRIGRWAVPGNPIAILLRHDHLWKHKNDIYAWAWSNFEVKSHAAYGDYDDSCLFGFAAGQVMESLYLHLHKSNPKARFAMHANEWQTAFALFYLRDQCPQIATLFTTHATGIGRSIAGNGKPLYDYFEGYNGDQMADELNMVSKHSVEKQAAHYADCFTTVSDITARECKQLLDKPVDIVTPNGFEPDFVPRGKAFTTRRAAAREALTREAEKQLGGKIPQNSLYVCIAGRQEWKNKGIDVFLNAMERLGDLLYREHPSGAGDVIAFVMIPYLDRPLIRYGRVSVIFVPHYLNGQDPMFKMSYYDLLIGMDASVFPSYYEPWGYTPLESVAFHVPTITTSLAGFGAWAEQQMGRHELSLSNGVAVIERHDANYGVVVELTARVLFEALLWTKEQTEQARKKAAAIAKKAEWKHFFRYYHEAYDIALSHAAKRLK